jgi:copper(I)-binding protein
MSMSAGTMKMRELSEGLTIKPGETVVLKPNGLHLMFMDVKQPPKQGMPIKGTLAFEKAGTINVEFDVAPMGAASLTAKKNASSEGKHQHH